MSTEDQHDQTRRLFDQASRLLPDTQAPIAELVAAGRGARRARARRRTALVALGAAAAVVAVAVGPQVLADGTGGGAVDDPVAGGPARTATVYVLTAAGTQDFDPDAAPWDEDGWYADLDRLAPHTVELDLPAGAGPEEHAAAAVEALVEEPGDEESLEVNPYEQFLGGPAGTVEDVVVSRADGLVTVDLGRDLLDPCDTCSYAWRPPQGLATQQLVWTVHASLGTTDPVLLLADGQPAPGVLFDRLDGPVAADPAVAPRTGSPEEATGGRPVMVLPSTPVEAGKQVEVAYDRAWTRGIGYSLTRTEPDAPTGDRDPAAGRPVDYWLTASRDGSEPAWAPGPADTGWVDVGVSGSGPDLLVVPPVAQPGTYELCTANAAPQVCGVLEVGDGSGEPATGGGTAGQEPPGHDLSAPPGDLEAYPQVTVSPDRRVVTLVALGSSTCPAELDTLEVLEDRLRATYLPMPDQCRTGRKIFTAERALEEPLPASVTMALVRFGDGTRSSVPIQQQPTR